ncbi:hypothetical protein C9374_000887 [Naegleria lovaniensis]|uniref:Uncharacterized protein n=1 Tax=Naegleria lovaniensis TaxID=51637 RepID=A0AA88GVZ2_NAELO|nr:uncharacterized protein C9374_000887 [Naegleria lovaniensis]KAG2388037.1 hypothetical protein C9374_000887 [Naegleria lovaniensis]
MTTVSHKTSLLEQLQLSPSRSSSHLDHHHHSMNTIIHNCEMTHTRSCSQANLFPNMVSCSSSSPMLNLDVQDFITCYMKMMMNRNDHFTPLLVNHDDENSQQPQLQEMEWMNVHHSLKQDHSKEYQDEKPQRFEIHNEEKDEEFNMMHSCPISSPPPLLPPHSTMMIHHTPTLPLSLPPTNEMNTTTISTSKRTNRSRLKSSCCSKKKNSNHKGISKPSKLVLYKKKHQPDQNSSLSIHTHSSNHSTTKSLASSVVPKIESMQFTFPSWTFHLLNTTTPDEGETHSPTCCKTLSNSSQKLPGLSPSSSTNNVVKFKAQKISPYHTL